MMGISITFLLGLSVILLQHQIQCKCSYKSIVSNIPQEYAVTHPEQNNFLEDGGKVSLECKDFTKTKIKFDPNITCQGNDTIRAPKFWPKCELFCNNTLDKFPKNLSSNESLGLVMVEKVQHTIFVGEEIKFKCADPKMATIKGDHFAVKCISNGNNSSTLENTTPYPKCMAQVPCSKDIPQPPQNSHMVLSKSKVHTTEIGSVVYVCDPFWKMDNDSFNQFEGKFSVKCDLNGVFPSKIQFPSCRNRKPLEPCKCLGNISTVEGDKLRSIFCQNNNIEKGVESISKVISPSRKRCGTRNLESNDTRHKCFCENVEEQSKASVLFSIRIRSEPWEWNFETEPLTKDSKDNYIRLQALIQSQLNEVFKNVTGFIQTFLVQFKKGVKTRMGKFPTERPKFESNHSFCKIPWSFPLENITYTIINDSMLMVKCKNTKHFLHSQNDSSIIGKVCHEDCATLWKIQEWPYCSNIWKTCEYPSLNFLEERNIKVNTNTENSLKFEENELLTCLNSSYIMMSKNNLIPNSKLELKCILTNESLLELDKTLNDTMCFLPCVFQSNFPGHLYSVDIHEEYDGVKISCKNASEFLFDSTNTFIGAILNLSCNKTHVQKYAFDWPSCSGMTNQCMLPSEENLTALNMISQKYDKLSVGESLNISCLNDSYYNKATNDSFISVICDLTETKVDPFYKLTLLGLDNSRCSMNKKSCLYPPNASNLTSKALNSSHWMLICANGSTITINNVISKNKSIFIPCSSKIEVYTCTYYEEKKCIVPDANNLDSMNISVIGNKTEYLISEKLNISCKKNHHFKNMETWAEVECVDNSGFPIFKGLNNLTCTEKPASCNSTNGCLNITMKCDPLDSKILNSKNFSIINIKDKYYNVGDIYNISCKDNFLLLKNGSVLPRVSIRCILKRSENKTELVPQWDTFHELLCISNISNSRSKRNTEERDLHYINAYVEIQFLEKINWTIFNSTWKKMDNEFIENKCVDDECGIRKTKTCVNSMLHSYQEQGYIVHTRYGLFNESHPELEPGEIVFLTCKQIYKGMMYMPIRDYTDNKPHDGILTVQCGYNNNNILDDPIFSINILPKCIPICQQKLISPPNYTYFELKGVLPIRDQESMIDISNYNGSKEEVIPIYSGDKFIYICTVPEWGINGGLDTQYDAVHCSNNSIIDVPTHAWPRCTARTHLINTGISVLLDRSDRKLSEKNKLMRYASLDSLMDILDYQDYIAYVTLPIVLGLSTLICCCFCCLKEGSPLCKICDRKQNKKGLIKELSLH
ncbi:uncharacterized protein [Lepeophtheirus salmonis]|uniref:uncharacterized protein n=1 Tax=Lepeophtheirus salmonis TaxID=72036 RepID=UPI003AF393EC